MMTPFVSIPTGIRRTSVSVGAAILLLAVIASAAPLREARVTEVIRDVKLLARKAAPRPASVSDTVGAGAAVRTGNESRAEMIFTDQTLARVGANTVFTFDEGTRTMDLGSGAMLLQVPKGAGGGKISTPAVTAGVTGTTIMVEYNADAPAKLMVLEGQARFCSRRNLNECVVVNGGEISIFTGGHFSKPAKFNVKKVIKSAKLIKGFHHQLPSLDLIYAVANAQGNEGSTSNALPPGGSLDSIDQRQNALGPPSPPPTPFRTPGN